ncbi:hypothetical protein ACC860_37130, partial [Rhizobium ruizarguesonis]
MAYGYFADRCEMSWVRPDLAEYAAIVRAQGRLREKNELRIGMPDERDSRGRFRSALGNTRATSGGTI